MKPSSQPVQTADSPATMLLVCMYGAFFLTGVAVLMLGPLLPLFSSQWGLTDSRVGMLLTAQFAGSFGGAVLLQNDLRRSLLCGSVAFAAGYVALALAAAHASWFWLGCCALLAGGFGIGQLINSISLIAAHLYSHKRGTALMSLNLTWSAGALLTPMAIGIARGHFSLVQMLSVPALAATLLCCLLWLAPVLRGEGTLSETFFEPSLPAPTRSGRRILLYFAALFLLYGALENSITGWIATFAIRYAKSSASTGAYSTTMLWSGIAAGRAGALLLLRRYRERAIQVTSVAATIVAAALLHTVDHPGRLFVLAALLGVCLAPFIPVTSSLLLGEAPSTPRQAATVMATAALGGAVLPLCVGIVSQHFHSLKAALELPPIVGLILLAACLLSSPGAKHRWSHAR